MSISANAVSSTDSEKIFSKLFIVKESRDKKGRLVSIWAISDSEVIGSVLLPTGKVIIIPGSQIINPTGGVLTVEVFHKIYANMNWHLIYNEIGAKIVIWPYLVAGAHPGNGRGTSASSQKFGTLLD